MRILLVEDDASVATVLQKVLTNEHYVVDVASDGHAGWQFVSAFHYDLVVLDVVLPKMDGLAFCRRLRECAYNMPVLLVTALDSSTKKIAGLNAGADDYITKPFEIEELLARVRALLRRVQTSILLTLEWEELRLQPNSREVSYAKTRLNLTPKEYALLELFLRNSSQVFSRRAILDNLWNHSEAPGEETVTSHIKGLRRKLACASAPTDFIETVYGVGYRLNPMLEDSSGDESSDKRIAAGQRKTGQKPGQKPGQKTARGTGQQSPEQTATTGSQQKTKAVLATLWNSVKFRQTERINLLKNIFQHSQTGPIPDGRRQAAYQAAHSLTGVLGIFGLITASDLAREIQELLKGKAPIKPSEFHQLQTLIASLEESLEQAIQTSDPLPETPHIPPVVLMDPRLALTSALVNMLWEKGITVKISPHFKALKKMLTILEGNKQENPSPSKAVTGAYPEVVLFEFSLEEASPAQLEQLSTLAHQIPSLIFLVCSADGTLTSRIKGAQLGNYPFLYNPDVAGVAKGIELLRSHAKRLTPKILVVDDDPQLLVALQARLELQGFQIVTLNKPTNFWQTLQEANPDLLLLDISMPEFSGIELCQAVRQAPFWNALPIMFFTSHADVQVQQAAFRAGADNLVEKSSPHSELLSHISEQIKRSRLQQAITAIAGSPPPIAP
ncbi:MAG: response regulator [Cyanobacteria bacterium J06560_5]